MKPSLQNTALRAAQKQSRQNELTKQTGRHSTREAGSSSTYSSHKGNLEGERAPIPGPCWAPEDRWSQLHKLLGHGQGHRLSRPLIPSPAASDSSRDLATTAPALACCHPLITWGCFFSENTCKSNVSLIFGICRFVILFAIPEPKATGRALLDSGPSCGSAGQGCSPGSATGFSGINDAGWDARLKMVEESCVPWMPVWKESSEPRPVWDPWDPKAH